jgi:hypothetical protein
MPAGHQPNPISERDRVTPVGGVTLSDGYDPRERTPTRLICTLIRVDCLVTADAPNGLICIGRQLGALIPGVMARRELP